MRICVAAASLIHERARHSPGISLKNSRMPAQERPRASRGLSAARRSPGIRCLKFGEFRRESGEPTATYRPGESRYETGPDDPVIARASATQPAGFVRIMLLPTKWFGLRSVKFVDPASNAALGARSARRVYNDTIIEI